MGKNQPHKTPSISQDTINWLLSSQTPSIRYLTYKNILHHPEKDPLLLKERQLILESSYVEGIFSDQDEKGFWYDDRHFYGPKYKGSHWAMYLLTELAVPPEDARMQSGADFMLWRMEAYLDINQKTPSYFQELGAAFCCYWGNWLRYQIYCGNFDHPMVQQVIDLVCRDMQLSGQCKYNADLACAWSVIRSLNGLALIPAKSRSTSVQDAIAKGLQFVLDDYDLVEANYPYGEKIHPYWGKISFPLFYHTDILFTLRVLRELDALGHPNAQRALEWLSSKQRRDGTWKGANPFKRRTHPFWIEPDTPHHWVTLMAASVFS